MSYEFITVHTEADKVGVITFRIHAKDSVFGWVYTRGVNKLCQ